MVPLDEEASTLESSSRQPQYSGEDLSPTTARELRGFYAYSVAAEIFAVCGVGKSNFTLKNAEKVTDSNQGSFLPVTLEQLARERGVLWSDKTTSCMVKKVTEKGGEVAARLMTRDPTSTNNQCVINVFGAEITTSSFAMYTFSIAVFIQALALVSFSAVADRGMP